MGPVGVNGEDGGRLTHRIFVPNCREAGAAEPGRVVGDSDRGGRAGSSGDSVGGHVHWQ